MGILLKKLRCAIATSSLCHVANNCVHVVSGRLFSGGPSYHPFRFFMVECVSSWKMEKVVLVCARENTRPLTFLTSTTSIDAESLVKAVRIAFSDILVPDQKFFLQKKNEEWGGGGGGVFLLIWWAKKTYPIEQFSELS